jgi:glycosyltransferase involved in cell wall biosynthesis
MTATATPRSTISDAAPGAVATRRRVALYYPWIYLTSGAERTILELTSRSRHDWTLFTNHYDAASTFPDFRRRSIVTLPPVSVDRSIKEVARAAWRIMRQRLPIDGYDALVIVCEGLGDLALFRSPVRPALCICLTPLRAAFDAEYQRRAAEQRTLAGRLLMHGGMAVFRAIDRRAWRAYDRVFCISEETRRRAVEGALASPDALEVLHVGLGIHGDAPADMFDRVFLVPGRIMGTKNIELAIAAFARFREQPAASGFRLVIAGIVDRKSESYLAELRKLAACVPGIEFVVAPSDRELEALYRRCYAVLFPAFNEDWGIVPLEGMSFGKPVVATNRGGPVEFVDPGLNGFLAPPEAAAFASRMTDLAESPSLARVMGRAAFDRSRRYSWDTFTARIDHAIAEGAV